MEFNIDLNLTEYSGKQFLHEILKYAMLHVFDTFIVLKLGKCSMFGTIGLDSRDGL